MLHFRFLYLTKLLLEHKFKTAGLMETGNDEFLNMAWSWQILEVNESPAPPTRKKIILTGKPQVVRQKPFIIFFFANLFNRIALCSSSTSLPLPLNQCPTGRGKESTTWNASSTYSARPPRTARGWNPLLTQEWSEPPHCCCTGHDPLHRLRSALSCSRRKEKVINPEGGGVEEGQCTFLQTDPPASFSRGLLSWGWTHLTKWKQRQLRMGLSIVGGGDCGTHQAESGSGWRRIYLGKLRRHPILQTRIKSPESQWLINRIVVLKPGYCTFAVPQQSRIKAANHDTAWMLTDVF